MAVLSFIVPLAIAGGYAVQELAETFGRARSDAQRLFPAAVLVGALCLLAVGFSFAHITTPSEYLCRAVGVWCKTPLAAADGPGLSNEWRALAALVVAALVIGWCAWSLYTARDGDGGAWRRSAPALSLAAWPSPSVLTRRGCSTSASTTTTSTRTSTPTRGASCSTWWARSKRMTARAGTGDGPRIAATSPGPGSDSYWPLPWYLNDYRSVGYHAKLPADAANLSIVIGNATQDAQLRALLGATHRKVGPTYQLRPGVDLVLYAQRGLADR